MRHTHLPYDEVAELVSRGLAEWVGKGSRPTAVSTSPVPMEWHKVKGIAGFGNSYVAAMQMLRGGEMRFPRMCVGGLVSPR